MGRIGETLRKARELREIDLREISDATKINIRYLEAIETNRFEVLPGGVFNKGFIRAYANYIGLDGQAMVDNYVHDLESTADDPGGAPPTSPGLHRPSAIPLRRAAQAAPGDAEATAGESDAAGIRDRMRAPLRLASLQDLPRGGQEAPKSGGEPNVLPRIVWLTVATGVLFCILAVWKYVADEPRAPLEAGQAQLPRPSSTGPPPVAPATGARAEGARRLAGTSGTAREEPPPEAGEVVAAPPQPQAKPVERDAAPPVAPQPHPSPARAGTTPDRPNSQPSAMDSSPPTPLPEPRSLPSGAAEEGMRILITARSSTRVRVICDGREAADRTLSRGETASLSCRHLVRLSAPDASSLRLKINGSECLPLGAPGSRLFGYVIRADDYRSLCPPAEDETDVPR